MMYQGQENFNGGQQSNQPNDSNSFTIMIPLSSANDASGILHDTVFPQQSQQHQQQYNQQQQQQPYQQNQFNGFNQPPTIDDNIPVEEEVPIIISDIDDNIPVEEAVEIEPTKFYEVPTIISDIDDGIMLDCENDKYILIQDIQKVINSIVKTNDINLILKNMGKINNTIKETINAIQDDNKFQENCEMDQYIGSSIKFKDYLNNMIKINGKDFVTIEEISKMNQTDCVEELKKRKIISEENIANKYSNKVYNYYVIDKEKVKPEGIDTKIIRIIKSNPNPDTNSDTNYCYLFYEDINEKGNELDKSVEKLKKIKENITSIKQGSVPTESTEDEYFKKIKENIYTIEDEYEFWDTLYDDGANLTYADLLKLNNNQIEEIKKSYSDTNEKIKGKKDKKDEDYNDTIKTINNIKENLGNKWYCCNFNYLNSERESYIRLSQDHFCNFINMQNLINHNLIKFNIDENKSLRFVLEELNKLIINSKISNQESVKHPTSDILPFEERTDKMPENSISLDDFLDINVEILGRKYSLRDILKTKTYTPQQQQFGGFGQQTQSNQQQSGRFNQQPQQFTGFGQSYQPNNNNQNTIQGFGQQQMGGMGGFGNPGFGNQLQPRMVTLYFIDCTPDSIENIDARFVKAKDEMNAFIVFKSLNIESEDRSPTKEQRDEIEKEVKNRLENIKQYKTKAQKYENINLNSTKDIETNDKQKISADILKYIREKETEYKCNWDGFWKSNYDTETTHAKLIDFNI